MTRRLFYSTFTLAFVTVGCATSEVDLDQADLTSADVDEEPLPAADYDGDWSGSWTDDTWGMFGDASLRLEVSEEGTATGEMVLTGHVFGGWNPEPSELDGTWDAEHFHFDGESELLGAYSFDFHADGSATGDAAPQTFSQVDTLSLSGTHDAETISFDFQIFDEDGGVYSEGTLEFLHE